MPLEMGRGIAIAFKNVRGNCDLHYANCNKDSANN